MLNFLIECITGLDRIERVARSLSAIGIQAIIEKGPMLILQRPSRYLDAATFTQEELLELIEQEAKRPAESFQPWITDRHEKPALLVFSSQSRVQHFAEVLSRTTNSIYGILSADASIPEMLRSTGISVFELNSFSPTSWLIETDNGNLVKKITPLKNFHGSQSGRLLRDHLRKRSDCDPADRPDTLPPPESTGFF